jgi:exonuclease SbcD
MKLVHLADLHLGYRQYQRLTPGGINQREADIARTFKAAIDLTIELQPDVVVVAGDVFHTVRPTNQAILFAFKQFSRLRQNLPEAIIVMVAGDHDTPRTVETGGILGLFRELGILVADIKTEHFAFEDRDLGILAVPHVPGPWPAFLPDPRFRRNVLVLHAAIEGTLPHWAVCLDRNPMEVPLAELHSSSWSYIALGHLHVYRQITEEAYYSGALEYASTNPWGERAEEEETLTPWRELMDQRESRLPGKGIIEHNLDTGSHIFHPIAPARELLDLPLLRARGMTAPELDVAIRETVDDVHGGIDGKIVRLLVYDVPRHVTRGLDHRMLREYRKRALHFHLDVRRPETIRTQSSGAPGRRASLSELLGDSLRSRHLDPDIDREELVTLGLRYLRDAEAAETPVLLEQEAE